jgi:hypothetical protein
VSESEVFSVCLCVPLRLCGEFTCESGPPQRRRGRGGYAELRLGHL